MAQCAQIMGVNVSEREAELFKARERCKGRIFSAHQAEYVKAVMEQADLLMRDIERVADWKARHG